jgi:hypothetical protein
VQVAGLTGSAAGSSSDCGVGVIAKMALVIDGALASVVASVLVGRAVRAGAVSFWPASSVIGFWDRSAPSVHATSLPRGAVVQSTVFGASSVRL